MEYCVKLKDVKSYIPEGHSGTVNCTLIDEKTGIKDFILIHGEVHPGGRAEAHSHPFDQGFYVLSGRGKVTIDGKEYQVEGGSAYCAPAGVTHQVVALGPEPLRVLRIDSRREDHSG